MSSEKKQLFEELFRENYVRMYRFAFAMLHDSEESRDAVGDVFAAAYAKMHSIDKASWEKYLIVATRNRCLDIIARKQTNEKLLSLLTLEGKETSYLSAATDEKRWTEIKTFIDNDLPPRARETLKLCFNDNLTYQQAADRMGITVAAVNKNIVSALHKLKERFK